MDHKELGTNSSVGAGVNDGSTKFAHNSPTVHSSRNKSYDVGSNSLGKVDATAARPCAIIGPDRVLPPNPDDTTYLKKMPGEAWPPPENVYRRPPDYPNKMSDYQPTRNISPRQTFQENMQRIMVPPTFSSIKSSDECNLKNTKPNMPQEVKYCDVPYNVNSVNSEHKSVRNNDIQMSNVNHSYTRNMPPPYGWPAGVNVRPLRPYAAPEFYQYQEFPSCAGPRPLTMIRPHRPPHEESAQVYSERLYQDANIRFKPYPTVKEKHQQPRYDYASNYPSTFHPPASIPPHKYDLQKTIHAHPYPMYPPVPFKYLDRRIHEPFIDGYHRSHSQQANFNTYHSQVIPPPYGPIPGNCMQNKAYSDASSKPMNVNKIQFENNNKVYLNLESRNKNYSVPENLYYSDMNHSQAMRGEIILPTHSTLNIPSMSQHSIYRKDNTPLKPYDYNPNYRIFDQSINVNHSLQRLPLQFSPNTISPDSNTSNDTAHTIGTSQEDCGYVSQSSTASIRSLDSGNMPMPHDIYRRHSYNNYDMIRNTFHPMGPIQIPKNKSSSSTKKNLDVRQFLQMWNEGDEEISEANKDTAGHNHVKKISSQSETINNHEQLYVLGLVNVPNDQLGKYDHIQKISKLPENIKGYNSIEILNQYEELLETPHVSNYNRSREYNTFLRSQIDKEITTKMPRPVSPLDVEAKISQSVIHKEVGCNFEIKPCSPEMLNVEVAAPVQNILGERMIEKVVNPITTKSPNLNRGETKNTMNDAVKVASCKMISDQYSPNNSPKNTKPSSYSVQDLERNAGLCLASLPQLDNDIELNFPEINQQFIKANQMESNVAPGLQTFPHMDLEQTNCLPHETNKNDSQKQNPSSQLAVSVPDKEVSKLSKYRKGRKCELNNSCTISKQVTVKSGECTPAVQRIDSVIIKNPDTIKTQDNESINSAIEINYSFQKEPKQSYSSLEYQNMEIDDLTCDTAIDFSLNKSEEETAVSYLKAIDRNINANLSPPLEEFNEDCLNEDDNNMALTSGSTNEQNTSAKQNIKLDKLVDNPQSEHPQCNRTEEYKKTSQEIDHNKCESLIKVPVKSPKLILRNKDCNVCKLANDEPKTSLDENLTSEKNTETPEHNIQDSSTSCQELIEENLVTKYPEILQSKYKIDIEKAEPDLGDESKTETDLSSPVKLDKENSEGYNGEDCRVSIKNVVSEISSFTKTCNDSMDITENPTIEEVLKDLSNQDTDKVDTKISATYSIVQNDICEDFMTSNNCLRKNEDEFNEIVSNVSLVNESNNESIDIVLEKSDTGTKICKEDYVDIYQPVNRESNINNEESADVIVSEQDPEKILKNSSDDISNYSEEIDCVKNETDLQELAIKIEKCSPQTVLKSTEELTQLDNNVQMVVSGFECISDNNLLNNSDKIVFSTETKRSSEETKSIKNDCVKKLDLSAVDCLSNELNPNNYNVQNEICSPKDETESVTSALELEKSKKLIKTSSTTMEQKKDEKNKNLADSESFFDKGVLAYTFEESSLSVNKSLPENTDVKIPELKQDAEAERDLETNYETNKEKVASECLSYKSCIPANIIEETKCFKNKGKILSKETDIERHLHTDYETTNIFKKPCLSPKNVTYSENLPLITAECRHDIEVDDDNIQDYETHMDIVESEFLSGKPYINLIEPVEESSNSSNKVIGETSAVISLETRPKIEADSSILKNLKSCVDKAESESLSYLNSPNYVKESCLGICNETSEHSIGEKEDSNKPIEINDNELVSVVKLDKNDPNLIHPTSVYNGIGPTCQKELFSPWFQKLLMFSEGICKLIKNKNNIKQDHIFGNNIFEQEDDLLNQNEVLVLSENNNIDALNSRDDELCSFDKETHLSNVMHIANEVLQSEHDKKHVTEQDSGSDKQFEGFKNQDTKLLPAEIENSAVLKPRKISKRSLSESALETYKDNDNEFVKPCKRKKCIKENQSILESHMITEDICNIIQTNRRNSISTFYNEDNVYIVIDNDLILTEETDDSDKICYTESTEEFLTSIESTNCEMNLNLDTVLCTDEANQVCEYSNSIQHVEEKSIDDWVDDVACIETVFSEDVAENIIIDVHASPKRANSLDLESVDEETTVFYDSDHIDKLKSIYGRTICNDNTQLIETLYRTPQMNVNKTLYHIESQDPEESLISISDSYLESNKTINCTDILETGISSLKVFDNKQKNSENLSLHSQCNQNFYPNFNHDSDFKFEELSIEEQENKFTTHSCESSNDYLTSNVPKENSSYSCSSSPEVSSTTSEEKSSSILLKITNCNGSRVSQINEMRTDPLNKLSYKLTEKGEYQSYSSNFSSSRTLITKAAQKYIPPLKETIYDLKVKLPLPQHRLHTLKQLKIAKVEPKIATEKICTVKPLISKKQKPKFEDVLKSIDEINFKRHKNNIKKGKISIPKVIIKKAENGAHYASSKSINRQETYNPDLTGRKWQPWVFLEKNNFIDKMALQNKAKAVYCHRKNSYVLQEKFRKYKSVYNASFVISQPNSETKGNLKYTIRLKHS